ncbi:hypothetical protein [Rhodoplanes roseus]|uniref:hypothetical protein n=1 Tax=Rhodoplanes roseus TaxID=29409 RepID=UPI001475C97B|nr:hypothetical protein [Rhodoplanes roseus]
MAIIGVLLAVAVFSAGKIVGDIQPHRGGTVRVPGMAAVMFDAGASGSIGAIRSASGEW